MSRTSASDCQCLGNYLGTLDHPIHVCTDICRQTFPMHRNQAPSFSPRPIEYQNHWGKFPNGLFGSKLQDKHSTCRWLRAFLPLSLACGHCSSWDLCIITLHPRRRTREQILINETLNENRFYADSGAAQRAMLLAKKEGKTLLRNHLVLHWSPLSLSTVLSAAFLSVCLTSHQCSSWLLFSILLLALAAEQYAPNLVDQTLNYFENII